MKKLTFLALGFLSLNLNAQTYFNQPSESTSIDASLGYHDGFGTENSNYGTDTYFKAFCLPGASGGQNTNRGLIRFDISSIPTDAQVISATFNLYAAGYINSNLPGHFGSNSSKLFRVTSNWNEGSVTWNTSPTYNVSDFVSVPSSSSFDQDYSFDVSDWAQDIILNQSTNLGFLLKLDVENPNNAAALAFYSSGASNANKRPSFEVVYQLGTDTLCFSTGAEFTDLDASLGYHDNYGTASNNYSTDQYFKAFCLPGSSGGQNTNRALIRFDLSSIPNNAQVTSAWLSLTATGYINSNLPGHFGNNNALLQLATNNWSLGTVTWNSQPTVTTTGEINLAGSISSAQDYNIDLIDFVQEWVANPSTNYGALFRLATEDPNSSAALTFHSSNAINANDRPTLCLTYKDGDLNVTTLVGEEYQLTLYPNPAGDNFNIVTSGFEIAEIRVTDMFGRFVYSDFSSDGAMKMSVSSANWNKGCYLVTILGKNNELVTQRIEIQ